jgi:hypothetical protein
LCFFCFSGADCDRDLADSGEKRKAPWIAGFKRGPNGGGSGETRLGDPRAVMTVSVALAPCGGTKRKVSEHLSLSFVLCDPPQHAAGYWAPDDAGGGRRRPKCFAPFSRCL